MDVGEAEGAQRRDQPGGRALRELGGVARGDDGGDRRGAAQKDLRGLDAARHEFRLLTADGDAVAAADAARLDDARLTVEDLDGLGGAFAHAGVAGATALADGGDERDGGCGVRHRASQVRLLRIGPRSHARSIAPSRRARPSASLLELRHCAADTHGPIRSSLEVSRMADEVHRRSTGICRIS